MALHLAENPCAADNSVIPVCRSYSHTCAPARLHQRSPIKHARFKRSLHTMAPSCIVPRLEVWSCAVKHNWKSAAGGLVTVRNSPFETPNITKTTGYFSPSPHVRLSQLPYKHHQQKLFMYSHKLSCFTKVGRWKTFHWMADLYVFMHLPRTVLGWQFPGEEFKGTDKPHSFRVRC